MVLYLLSRAGAGVMALVLAGVAIAKSFDRADGAGFGHGANPYAMSEMVTWMLGSLKDRTMSDLEFAAPLVALGIAVMMTARRGLDALVLGEGKPRRASASTSIPCGDAW